MFPAFAQNYASGILQAKHDTPSSYAHCQRARKLNPEQQAVLMQDILASGARCRMRVRGSSMAPTIQDLDVVTIAPLTEPHEGDIVVFMMTTGKQLVMHRIQKRQTGGWLTKGDNCLTDDGIIPESNILGKVVQIEKPSMWRKRLLKLFLAPQHDRLR